MSIQYQFSEQAIEEAKICWGNSTIPAHMKILGIAKGYNGQNRSKALFIDKDTSILYLGESGMLIATPGGF
jgi:hypothetical protein